MLAGMDDIERGLLRTVEVLSDAELEDQVDERTPQLIADALAARSGLVVRQLLPGEAVRSVREDLAFMRVMKAAIARSGPGARSTPPPCWPHGARTWARSRCRPATLRKLTGFYEASGLNRVVSRTGVAPWTLPYREVAVTWFFAPTRLPSALGRPYAV